MNTDQKLSLVYFGGGCLTIIAVVALICAGFGHL